MEDKINKANQPDTTSVHLPRTETVVRAYAPTEYNNTDPSGSWTGRPAVSAAVYGGKVCVRIKGDFTRPIQDADDL